VVGNGQSQTTAHNGPLHQPGGNHTTVAENSMGMKIIKPFVLHGYSPLIKFMTGFTGLTG
jgi:hypothetical protein